MSAVTTETAKVYRGGGRRYFSKRAAYDAVAREMLKERCECERFDPQTGYGDMCKYHDDDWGCDAHGKSYGTRVRSRLTRWLRWRDSRGGQ